MLTAWELGEGLSSPSRTLAVLAAACPDSSSAQLAGLPLGTRDALLLELREQAFGSRFVGLAARPRCGEAVELAFDAADIRVPETVPAPHLELDVEGRHLRFRLPNGGDLIAWPPSARTSRARVVC